MSKEYKDGCEYTVVETKALHFERFVNKIHALRLARASRVIDDSEFSHLSSIVMPETGMCLQNKAVLKAKKKIENLFKTHNRREIKSRREVMRFVDHKDYITLCLNNRNRHSIAEVPTQEALSITKILKELPLNTPLRVTVKGDLNQTLYFEAKVVPGAIIALEKWADARGFLLEG